MKKDIASWFEGLPATHRELLLELRRMIIECNGDVREDIKWNQPCYSINRLFCYLQRSKTHVTIGFQKGAHLNDPAKLLTGQGKDMRHVKIPLTADIPATLITALIQDAIIYDGKT